MKLRFISDPSHGYLEIPIELINKYNIYNRISNFSFKTKQFAYLEEDCDAPLFFEAIKKNNHINNFEVITKYIDYSAPCRDFDRFQE